jgi:hypothetical protein
MHRVHIWKDVLDGEGAPTMQRAHPAPLARIGKVARNRSQGYSSTLPRDTA